jgi:CheY-like chemotaxis protein
MSSVLLAEDEFLIRAVVVDALGAIGLNCIEAATGQAALDVVTGQRPSRPSSSISACPTCRARR